AADAALQAGSLVAREVEPAALHDELEEGLELFVLVFGHQDAPPSVRSVARARGISSRDRTKSTAPVWIAAEGIPKNSELASSCAMTVPPIFFTACTPMDPSVPVPV